MTEKETTNKDVVDTLKKELNVSSNDEILSLLAPHLPGIRKPGAAEGYPEKPEGD